MRSTLRSIALGVVLLAAGPAHAQPAPVVEVDQPWARPTAPRQSVGAAYMRLRSVGGDRLLGVSSPAATRVEVHEMRMDGDVMRMREREALELPAGEVVALAPGGLHVMLIGLAAPLQAGERVPLVLRFERGGEQRIEVIVAGSERAAGSAGHAPGHKH